MKKTLALLLAVLMCVALLAACATTDNTSEPEAVVSTDVTDGDGEETSNPEDLTARFTENAVLKVMLMPQGDMNASTVEKVTAAVNARIAELGYTFTVEFSWSGPAWGFDNLSLAYQTGDVGVDIVPAHSWSGDITYVTGAKTGQFLRLDDPADNLLEKFGPALYGSASETVKAAGKAVGPDGTAGIYGYIIEKDCVTDVGYLVNTTVIEELGFTLADFTTDISTWEPILAAFKEKYPNKYPLNIEPVTLDRAVNRVAFVDDNNGPLGIIFDATNISGTAITVSNRYANEGYKTLVNVMNGYYKAGYADPDQITDSEVYQTSFATRRDGGDFLISTCVYAPGFENTMSAAATTALGVDTKIDYVSAYESPVGFTETANGSGLAVYGGTDLAPEAVTFLNMLATDTVIGNLLSEGVEGAEGDADTSYYVKDGVAWRQNERAGWNIWRYGVVGSNSAATPLGDVDATGEEWTNMKAFNDEAAALASTGWVFDKTSVEAEYTACIAVCKKYCIPLGSGGLDPAELDTFLAELEAAGVEAVLTEANSQYAAFAAAQ